MKKYAALLIFLSVIPALALAEVYNPNGKLFVYREYMENPGNMETVNRIFRVDNDGKVEVIFSALPGGTEDPTSVDLRVPDLMQGQFKIEDNKLYFYTSDNDEYCWPGRDVFQTTNPIMFVSNQAATQASRETDQKRKAELQEKADYMKRIYEMKKIEYVYDKKCNCLHVNEASLGRLPKKHLYQGDIIPIEETQKRKYLKQILTKRQEAYKPNIFPELCHLQEGSTAEVKGSACKADISCSIRPFGFDSYFHIKCPADYCKDLSKPDITGCYKGDSQRISPDIEAYSFE